MNIIKYRKIFFSISGILILASLAAIAVFGLQLGIDFVGGTLWQIKITTDNLQPTTDNVKEFFEKDLELKNITVFPAENQSFLIRLPHLSEEEHQRYLRAMDDKFGLPKSASVEELRYETIGPMIGRELRNKAIWAVILVLLGISLYIIYAFRKVSYPVKSFKYGLITLLTLFHDVIIPIGFLSFLGWRFGIEFNTMLVIALLVIMGFSVHDTIVVFDRIRENLLLHRGRNVAKQHSDRVKEFSEIINFSIRQTLARSINTSLTLILVLAALFFSGPVSLKYFVLTILIGTTIGTYSSIFIASPALWRG